MGYNEETGCTQGDEYEQASLTRLSFLITEWRKGKGFVTNKENMLEKLMLAVTELAEAAEDVRHANWEHFGEEIADCVIRLLDICGALNINLQKELANKMRINEKRPYRHGTQVSA